MRVDPAAPERCPAHVPKSPDAPQNRDRSRRARPELGLTMLSAGDVAMTLRPPCCLAMTRRETDSLPVTRVIFRVFLAYLV